MCAQTRRGVPRWGFRPAYDGNDEEARREKLPTIRSVSEDQTSFQSLHCRRLQARGARMVGGSA